MNRFCSLPSVDWPGRNSTDCFFRQKYDFKVTVKYLFRYIGYENEDEIVVELTRGENQTKGVGVVFQIGDAPTNQLPYGQIIYKVYKNAFQ